MTSERSFSNNLLKLEKDLFRRRNWALAIALFLHFLCFVAGNIVSLVAVSRNWDHANANYRKQLLYTAQDIFGLTSPVYLIAVLLGIFLAIQGFSWLFSRRELDFYMSQPVSRKMRFVSIYLNGILIYVISYLSMMLIGFLAALSLGGMNGALVAEAFAEFVRCLLLFLGVYHIALLAVMWTGTLVWSILGSLFLLLAEYVVLILVDGYRSLYYSTYVSSFMEPKLSAIFNYLLPVQSHIDYPSIDVGSVTLFGSTDGTSLSAAMRTALPYDIRALIVAVLVLVCVVVSWRMRKSESAGNSIVFKPVRITVRVITSVFAGLIAGLAFFNTLDSQASDAMFFDLFCILLVTLLTAVILQMLFNRDFRAGFRNIVPAICAALIVLGISLFYRYDVSGYDSYLPDADKVESCALYVWDGYSINTDVYNWSNNTNSYAENTMYLTDVSSVEKLAQNAIDALDTDREDEYYTSINVLYRMKDGKEVHRSYLLPKSTADTQALNAILASKEYLSSRFPLTAETLQTDQVMLTYETSYGSETVSGAYYTALKNAYTADLENYDFDLASTVHPIGMLYVNYKDPYSVLSGETITYPVYESFSNTVAFLEDHDLWVKPYPEASDIEVLTVTRDYYFDSYDFYSNVELYSYVDDPEDAFSYEQVDFTDPEEIQEILEVSFNTAFDEAWYREEIEFESYAGFYTTPSGTIGPYSGSLSFASGDLPLFVKSRFSENKYKTVG